MSGRAAGREEGTPAAAPGRLSWRAGDTQGVAAGAGSSPLGTGVGLERMQSPRLRLQPPIGAPGGGTWEVRSYGPCR